MSCPSDNRTDLTHPRRCYFIGAYILLALITSAAAIGFVHANVVPIPTQLLRAHLMCGLFGTVGASIAAIRKYYRALITEATAHAAGQAPHPLNWSWGWTFYYLSRPILGGVLGALTYTLSFVGVSVLTEPVGTQISDEGRYLLYGLSFMSGFAVSHVLDRLNTISKRVFKSEQQGF